MGISCFYHDSAACLVRDGHIVAAAQEERFSRKKHDPRFPSADEYGLGLGIAKTTEKFNWAISYFYEEYDSRIKNNALGGTLGGTANGESVSYTHLRAHET